MPNLKKQLTVAMRKIGQNGLADHIANKNILKDDYAKAIVLLDTIAEKAPDMYAALEQNSKKLFDLLNSYRPKSGNQP